MLMLFHVLITICWCVVLLWIWCSFDYTLRLRWCYVGVMLMLWWCYFNAMLMLYCGYLDIELISLWRHVDVIFWVASMLRWGYADIILLCMCMSPFMSFRCYSDVSLRFRWYWFELSVCCFHATFMLLWGYYGLSFMLIWRYLQVNVLCAWYYEVILRSYCGYFDVVSMLIRWYVDCALLFVCCHANVILILLAWYFEAFMLWWCCDGVTLKLVWCHYCFHDVLRLYGVRSVRIWINELSSI